ncbi:MULE domain-containing protein [Trichonephila clavipes]|nr:MULE domain-containing protein [Trichonephila clavipes]
MIDDAPAFYNAWSYVMGVVKNVLLCAWHLTRNWHQNLNKIKNPEKRKIVNKALKAVKDELCLETSSNLMKQFIEDLLNGPDTSEFGKYFQQNYAQRPEKWGYYYRTSLGINTNMYLESLHKKLVKLSNWAPLRQILKNRQFGTFLRVVFRSRNPTTTRNAGARNSRWWKENH